MKTYVPTTKMVQKGRYFGEGILGNDLGNDQRDTILLVQCCILPSRSSSNQVCLAQLFIHQQVSFMMQHDTINLKRKKNLKKKKSLR